jgi:c-di-GMP-binding flagellar brake protein YcgR
MNDRRQLIRWCINKETNMKLQGQDKPVTCVVEDINIKGLKIFSRHQLAKEGSVCLAVDFGRDFSMDIEAEVAWRRSLGAGYVYGLYFTKIKDADKERLYRYIVQCCSEQMKEHRWKVEL